MKMVNADQNLFAITTIFGLGEKCVSNFWPLEVLLRAVLQSFKARRFLRDLHWLEIWIIIEGETDPQTYDASGPGKFAVGKAPPRAIINCTIRRHQYEHASGVELQALFAEMIEATIESLLTRLEKRQLLTNVDELRRQIKTAVNCVGTDPLPQFYELGSTESMKQIEIFNEKYRGYRIFDHDEDQLVNSLRTNTDLT